MRSATFVAFLASILTLAGCRASIEVQKLPAYQAAIELGGPKACPAYEDSQLDDETTAGAVPFAIINGSSPSLSVREINSAIVSRARKLESDFVLIGSPEKFYAGSTSTHWGFGITTSSAQHGNAISGLCFRTAKARLGIHWDRSRMVTAISAESDARENGLLEGDTVLSIAGKSLAEDSIRSPHNAAILDIEPGDAVQIVWIRPGGGRMESTITALPASRPWEQIEPLIRPLTESEIEARRKEERMSMMP